MKLTKFLYDTENKPVSFVKTVFVKEGVSCDVYNFDNDSSRDLAIVTVKAGHKTPLQKVLLGNETIEGHVSGDATLTIWSDNVEKVYRTSGVENIEVAIKIGQLMQWDAIGESDLVFYEICDPPYVDGRFKNITE